MVSRLSLGEFRSFPLLYRSRSMHYAKRCKARFPRTPYTGAQVNIAYPLAGCTRPLRAILVRPGRSQQEITPGGGGSEKWGIYLLGDLTIHRRPPRVTSVTPRTA